MLWSVRHKWPGGAQFTFNCYHHWATLVVRNTADGSGHFLHSKEGVTQGDPLAMIAYGIGVLPLIIDLRRAHPRVMQPWYADDTGAGGEFCDIMAHFRDLQLRGAAWGTIRIQPRASWLWPKGFYPGPRSTSAGWVSRSLQGVDTLTGS